MTLLADIPCYNIEEALTHAGLHPYEPDTKAKCPSCGEPYHYWKRESYLDGIMSDRLAVFCPDCGLATGRGINLDYMQRGKPSPAYEWDTRRTEIENGIDHIKKMAQDPDVQADIAAYRLKRRELGLMR